MKKLFSIIAMALLVFACWEDAPATQQSRPYTLGRVSFLHVVMHDPLHFTFFVSQPNAGIGMLTVRPHDMAARMDAASTEAPWIEYTCGSGLAQYQDADCDHIPVPLTQHFIGAVSLTMHVHSINELPK